MLTSARATSWPYAYDRRPPSGAASDHVGLRSLRSPGRYQSTNSSRSARLRDFVFSVKCLILRGSYTQSAVVHAFFAPGYRSKKRTLALTP
jgi:hypothetical protein